MHFGNVRLRWHFHVQMTATWVTHGHCRSQWCMHERWLLPKGLDKLKETKDSWFSKPQGAYGIKKIFMCACVCVYSFIKFIYFVFIYLFIHRYLYLHLYLHVYLYHIYVHIRLGTLFFNPQTFFLTYALFFNPQTLFSNPRPFFFNPRTFFSDPPFPGTFLF